MEKANAFINSLDNSENFKICEFEPKDKLLVKVKSTTEFFSDGSPVIKTFFKSPLTNYVFQPSKKYQVIWNESDEVMYWYDDDNQTWYYCTMIYEIEDLRNL